MKKIDVFDEMTKKKHPDETKMVVTSMNVSKHQLDQINLLCKSHKISRCEFIRQSLDLGLNKIRTSQDRGFIYVIEADFLKSAGIKLGKSKNIKETLDLYWNDRKVPGKKIRHHLIDAAHMDKAERLFIEYWERKGKRNEKTEFFYFDQEDLLWFQNEEYLKIPEFKEAIMF